MQYSQLLSYIISTASLVLVLLILIAGLNEHVLNDYFFLKINTASLLVPSPLSKSTFLRDLSNLTGSDLVGEPASAGSLGLAQSYTVSLLTACGEDTDCTSPRFGYHFNPVSDLKLDTTSLEGSFSSSFLNSFSSYETVSKFLAIGYILAFVFTFVTPMFILLSSRYPRAAIIGATTSILAFGFSLTASGSATGIFLKVRRTFNSSLEPIGIRTSLGTKLFIIGWVLTILSLINSVILFTYTIRVSKQRRQDSRGVDRLLDKSGIDENQSKLLTKPGFLKQLPIWRRHNYSEIEKQGLQTAVTGKVYNGSDRDILMTRGFGGGDEEEEEHDLAREQTRGIQLQPMGFGATRDLDTSYEPYRQQVGAAF